LQEARKAKGRSRLPQAMVGAKAKVKVNRITHRRTIAK